MRFETFVQDIRFALRLLVRDRRFALSATLVLGLGIGVNNMYFTLIYGHTLRGLPIQRPDRMLFVTTTDERGADRPLSYPEFDAARAAGSFAALAAFSAAPATISEERRAPERYQAAFVTANAFTTIGVAPMLGRPFTAEDDLDGAPLVVLLGERAWRTRYSGDPAIAGRSVVIDGVPATVVGVMKDRSGFPSTAEVWMPLAAKPGLGRTAVDARILDVFGRLKDDVTPAAARTEVEAILERALSSRGPTDKPARAHVVPVSEHFFGRPTDPAWISFIAAACLVLFVSTANAANLMLARSHLRAREIAIRASVGASRTRVFRQLLTESLVLATVGGAVGLGISLAGVQFIRTLIPENALPYWINYQMDARVVGALIGVSWATVLIFGLIPAIHASRADLNQVLKAGGQVGRRSRSAAFLTSAFLVAEFALTIVLLSYGVNDVVNASAGVDSDAVINTPELVSAAVTLPADPYPTPGHRLVLYRALRERLAAVPGVTELTMTSALPLRGAPERELEIEGRATTGDTPVRVRSISIGRDYFRTLNLPVIAGREFGDDDGRQGRLGAIVNQRFVETYLATENPIGRRIRLTPLNAPATGAEWMSIIGVSQSIRQRNTNDPDPNVYVPFDEQPPATAALLLRLRGDRPTIIDRVRDAMREVAPSLPLYRVMTLPQAIEEVVWVGRMSIRLSRLLVMVALALATIGLYAVTAHAVTQRTREIGVRMALGASTRQIRWLIVSRAARQVAVGLFAGVICSIAWDASFFTGEVDYRIANPSILFPIAGVLTVVTIAACVVPVRRASRLDPVAALRNE